MLLSKLSIQHSSPIDMKSRNRASRYGDATASLSRTSPNGSWTFKGRSSTRPSTERCTLRLARAARRTTPTFCQVLKLHKSFYKHSVSPLSDRITHIVVFRWRERQACNLQRVSPSSPFLGRGRSSLFSSLSWTTGFLSPGTRRCSRCSHGKLTRPLR